MFKLDVSVREIEERERWIYFASRLYDFCAFRYLDPHQIPRDRIILATRIDLSTPILSSFHFSSIDSDLDVVSTLEDHPERATFDHETRLRMIQTNAPRCATLEVSKCRPKRRIGWRKRRNRPIPSNSNSCSIDVLLLSAISRRVSAHNLRPTDIRSAARRVHR